MPVLVVARGNRPRRTILLRPASPRVCARTRRICGRCWAVTLGHGPPKSISYTGRRASPRLKIDEACSLRFNVSNSGNLAAYAFTTGCEIGVDVEQHRALHDLEHIAAPVLLARRDGRAAGAFRQPKRSLPFSTAGPAKKPISKRWVAASPFRWTAFGLRFGRVLPLAWYRSGGARSERAAGRCMTSIQRRTMRALSPIPASRGLSTLVTPPVTQPVTQQIPSFR